MDYKISKSQKKVLKRLHRFLSQGDTKAGDDSKSAGGSSVMSDNPGENTRKLSSIGGSVLCIQRVCNPQWCELLYTEL